MHNSRIQVSISSPAIPGKPLRRFVTDGSARSVPDSWRFTVYEVGEAVAVAFRTAEDPVGFGDISGMKSGLVVLLQHIHHCTRPLSKLPTYPVWMLSRLPAAVGSHGPPMCLIGLSSLTDVLSCSTVKASQGLGQPTQFHISAAYECGLVQRNAPSNNISRRGTVSANEKRLP